MTGEVPFTLWYGRPPTPLVESDPEGLGGGFDHKFADQREYAQYLYEQSLQAVDRVKLVQEKMSHKMETSKRSAQLKKDYRVGDLVWVYTVAPPGKEKDKGDKKLGKFRRLWTQWRGPYFIREVRR